MDVIYTSAPSWIALVSHQTTTNILAETHQYVCMHTHRYVWQFLLKTKFPVGLSLRCFFLSGVFHFLWKIPRVYTNTLLITLLCVCRVYEAGIFFAATGPCWFLRYFQSCGLEAHVSNINEEYATGLCCCHYFNGWFIALNLLSACSQPTCINIINLGWPWRSYSFRYYSFNALGNSLNLSTSLKEQMSFSIWLQLSITGVN